MIMIKKANYDLKDLQMLSKALLHSLEVMDCHSHCDFCRDQNVCRDLMRARLYVESLINQEKVEKID